MAYCAEVVAPGRCMLTTFAGARWKEEEEIASLMYDPCPLALIQVFGQLRLRLVSSGTSTAIMHGKDLRSIEATTGKEGLQAFSCATESSRRC